MNCKKISELPEKADSDVFFIFSDSVLHPELFVDEHDLCLHTLHRRKKHEQSIADACRHAAVMTFAVKLAGVLIIKAGIVFYCGNVARPVQRGIEIGAYLVSAGNDKKTLVTVNLPGEAVAGAVNVQYFAILGNGICTGDINRGAVCFFNGLRTGSLPVPVNAVALFQLIVQTELLHGLASAYADGGITYLRGEIPHSLGTA